MDDLQISTTAPELLTEPIQIDAIDADDSDEALSVKATRFLRLLWERRKVVLRIVAAGIAGTLLYALLSVNTYTSITTLMPPGNSSPYTNILSALSGPAVGVTSDMLGLETPGELYVKILGSRNVQDGLIARFDLARYYNARIVDDARKGLTGDTRIEEDVKSGVISVSVRAKKPELAAGLANGYAEELNRVLTENSTSSARRERIFLEERLKEVKLDLDNSSQALSQFASKSKTMDIASQAKSMMDEGLKLEGDLIESRSELAALKQTYSEDNARVKAAQARVASLEKEINSMGGLSGRSETSGEVRKSIYPSATELPTLGLTYNELDRRVRVDEELWEALTKQYEAAKVQEAKEIPTVRVLDVAAAPERKSAPTRWLIMVVGTTVFFFVACLWVFGVEKWQSIDAHDERKVLVQQIATFLVELRKRR